MSRSKRKKHKNNSTNNRSKPQSAKPSYWNDDYVTVGMMEEFCKQIKLKSSIIQLMSYDGTQTESVVKCLYYTDEHDKTKNIGLAIVADLSWSMDEDEDNDDIDEEEDNDSPFVDSGTTGAYPINLKLAVQEALRKGKVVDAEQVGLPIISCSSDVPLDPDPEKGKPLPKGLLFLGDEREQTDAKA